MIGEAASVAAQRSEGSLLTSWRDCHNNFDSRSPSSLESVVSSRPRKGRLALGEHGSAA